MDSSGVPEHRASSAARTAHGGGDGPDHRDLYLIIAGVILGILLGPAVLGRLAPERYAALFEGPPLQSQLAALNDRLERDKAMREALITGGADHATLEAFDQKHGSGVGSLREALASSAAARGRHAEWLTSRMVALVLAVLALMVVETLLEPGATNPRGASVRRRMAGARYALIALWLAMVLAQPALLRSLPVVFTVALVAVALAAALVPLRRRAAPTGQ